MKGINAALMCDFYKIVHRDMINQKMTKSMSYYTPRMSRVKRWDKVVMFGLQMFCKTWLLDYFNENFFEVPEEEIVADYQRVLDNSFGKGIYNTSSIRELHRLGYLPLEIIALPEGTLVPIHVPMFGITNTHPDFAWLPQALESLISAEMWYPQITATVGKTYRDIVDKYYALTCEDDIPRAKALGSFDFRGDQGLDAALKAAAGWCMSFVNTATVPAIPYLEKMFGADCTKEAVAYGAVSTEHFVMCSNFAVDGDEETFLRKMLTELYPNTSFSAVLDSYDYWNVIDNILPKLHNEIMAHNGCMLMRGDSGDCVEVVTKTVFKLWEQFGGTVNSKGYKVLDPHVKAIYGDSITVQRCEQIYEILMQNGFACSNVALGVGSFSMHCIEETEDITVTADDGQKFTGRHTVLKPFTRDTFSSCIKACYAEIDGKEYPIFKDPKEGGFKKSQKGLCYVYRDDNGELAYKDGYVGSTIPEGNLLETVFKDGRLVREYTLSDIRNRLNNNAF
ncbi:nicotinamide phosphoribosyltransferase domain-containing protein [Ruminococcus albus]|uniref:Nicotinamide phosphoribosyltransferase n=1 Tax=Ruminococcus albus (strain ATCC 27210 / DSM 20455 / JCM 14654 / NCDO 2250 / 7) TaxID=697329 RepID=E6UGI5_RUMA7|nr:nicotinamide phosphoribosyltransferase domain-containing protein [Ruminococcus albus]ADU23108.1 Nicotinamide phosphoribosyltransferase [Ruminococcus albus 7 = DSM 20455]